MTELDALDLALLRALRDSPRAGVLQLSRITQVARATVQARLDRMERAGVITGYGPDIDLAAAGYTVLAFVTLEITQGALDQVRDDLAAIPGVLEAHAITGSADVICKVAATSHADLQQTLLRIDSSPSVARSTSAIALSTVIKPRDLPLLTARPAAPATRSPAFRGGLARWRAVGEARPRAGRGWRVTLRWRLAGRGARRAGPHRCRRGRPAAGRRTRPRVRSRRKAASPASVSVTTWIRRLAASRVRVIRPRASIAFRWCVSVASRTPTASASSRWFPGLRIFRLSRISQIGSVPPASARASSNARSTTRAA